MSHDWELTIADADPLIADFGSLAVGDVDGDGHDEMIMGGTGGLVWFRPATGQRGLIATGDFHVGVDIGDVDGDGTLEVVAAHATDKQFGAHVLCWFKPGASLSDPWTKHVIDNRIGGAHDVICVDIDEDGVLEVVASSGSGPAGLYIFKPDNDPTTPWSRHVVQEGLFREGTSIGDVDDDGQLEILFGPEIYHAPADGPLSGPWECSEVAPSVREMTRTALVDITGTGRPDVVICESEYFEGRIAWVENRILEDPARPWVVHEIEATVYYGHSLQARRDETTGEVRIFMAEMAEGGWSASRNYDARVLEYVSTDGGRSWSQDIIEVGRGTHEAVLHDIDHDGELEVVSKEWGRAQKCPRVLIWKKTATPSPLTRYAHRMLDRDKADTAVDIMAADLTGNGSQDVVCGSWWYRSNDWKKFDLPQDFEAIAAADINGDGRAELIGLKRSQRGYDGLLNTDLVWIASGNPETGPWVEHTIGAHHGDWPHGVLIAAVLPDGKLAMVTGYHNADKKGTTPEIWEIPADPTQPWPKRVLADIAYGEEFLAADIDGDGLLDIVAGSWWLRNMGDGTFTPYRIAPEGFKVARMGLADITGDGRLDVILGEAALDFENQFTPMSKLVWLANPADPTAGPWQMHVIDKVRCPHSIGVADMDGDGEMEIVCGEHDPFYPYRSRCRMLVYKKAEPAGLSWKQYVLDNRFEHHDGARIIEFESGRLGILSHGWKDSRYVHLWEGPELSGTGE